MCDSKLLDPWLHILKLHGGKNHLNLLPCNFLTDIEYSILYIGAGMEVQKEDIFIAEIIFLPSNRISQQSSPRDPRINVKYPPKQL